MNNFNNWSFINHWLHQAEIMWYKDIEKFYENN